MNIWKEDGRSIVLICSECFVASICSNLSSSSSCLIYFFLVFLNKSAFWAVVLVFAFLSECAVKDIAMCPIDVHKPPATEWQEKESYPNGSWRRLEECPKSGRPREWISVRHGMGGL